MDEAQVQFLRRKKGCRGFTLIELLVVVAIIALLIAILLPSLGRARENAKTTVCGTHLKQIATANLMYIGDNNGTLITTGIANSVPRPGNAAGSTQFWANDLASEGYLPSKNNLDPSGVNAVVSTNTIFYCPDGNLTPNPITPDGGVLMYSGNRPRSIVNTWYMESIAATSQVGETAAFTWYTLNSHNISAQSAFGVPGAMTGAACAFVQWNKDPVSNGVGSETLAAPGGFGRRITLIQNTQKFVLALEASGASWDANGYVASAQPNWGNETSFPAGQNGHGPFRMAGRHGDVLNNGNDGYCNMAYFDGHVQKNSTAPYSLSPNVFVSPLGITASGFMPPTVPDTIFYFQSQP